MSLKKKDIKNLTGGVSEQPHSQRFDSQCEEQKNFLSDAIKGLVKRPGADFVSHIQPTTYGADGPFHNSDVLDPKHLFLHSIKRDDNEELLFVVRSGRVALYNASTGAPINLFHDPGSGVAIDDDTGYDALGTPYLEYTFDDWDKAPYEAVTISDYTFFLNKAKLVASRDDTNDDGYEQNGFVFIQEGQFSTTYTVTLTDTDGYKRVVTAATEKSSTSGAENDYKTSNIIAALHWGLEEGTPGGIFNTTNAPDYCIESTKIEVDIEDTGSFVAADFEFVRDDYGSSIFIRLETPAGEDDPTIIVEDSWGNSISSGCFNEIKSFDGLPLSCWNNFHLEITGSPESDIDNYYVKFITDDADVADNVIGAGHWEESVGWGEELRLDRETMPHVLVRIDDDNYWFGPLDDGGDDDDNDDRNKWEEKKAGDSTTNPFPSFVGNRISDLVFFKSRLGFVSGENLILSETDDPFEFFRTSVTQVLPSDRIDIQSSLNDITYLNHVVPFADQLLVFSERAQFIVSYGNQGLTPQTASLSLLSSYDSSPTVKPKALDNSVIFARNKGAASDVMELYPTGSTNKSFEARNLTAHIPSYIKGDVIDIRTSSLAQCILVRTDETVDEDDYDTGPKLYVYKFFDTDKGRVQSSWSKYLFNHYVKNILFFDFIGPDCRIVNELTVANTSADGTGTSKYVLDTIRFDNTDDITYSLDSVVDNSVCLFTGTVGAHTLGYDSAEDWTIIKLPYEISTNDDYSPVIVNDSGVTGTILAAPINSDDGRELVKVSGDWKTDAAFNYGASFLSEYEFSKQYLKKGNLQGEPVPVIDGRTTIRFVECYFSNSQLMKLEASFPDLNRDSTVKTFTGTTVGGAILGDQTEETGTLRLFVGARNDAPTIRLFSDTHQTATITGASFSINYNNPMLQR